MNISGFILLLFFPHPLIAEIDSNYFCKDISLPFFSVKKSSGSNRMVTPGRTMALPFEFASPKPPGTARVIILGESTALLLSRGTDSLREYLKISFPGKKLELINAGMSGYDSSRIFEVFKESLLYQPDLLVLLSGNNETGREPCPGLKAEIDRRSRRLMTRLAELSVPQEDARWTVSLSIHEERVRKMAELSRRSKVPLILCTLPVNLRDFAPGGRPRDADLPAIREVNSDPASALRRLSLADPKDPFALFYSGRALEKLGRAEEAKAKFAAAIKYDPLLDRCSGERNEMIRRIAMEAGACLSDLESAFEGASQNGIPGGTEFSDGVHWSRSYVPFVIGTLARDAARCLGKPSGAIPDPHKSLPAGNTREDFRVTLSYASTYALKQAGDASPPIERIITLLEKLHRLDRPRLSALLRDPAALREEVLLGPWAPQLKRDMPDWRPSLLRAAAEMYRRAGNGTEASELETLAAADGTVTGKSTAEISREPAAEPGRESSLNILVETAALIKKGDLAKAEILIRQASKTDPDNLPVLMTGCALAERTRSEDPGEELCGEAIALAAYPQKNSITQPGSLADAFFQRAKLRSATGKSACSDLRLAISKAPASWPQTDEALGLLKALCDTVK